MLSITESVQDRSRGAVVLSLAVLYLLFVLSYVWYLPNYNLIKSGGRHIADSHAIFKPGTRHSNYNAQTNKGVWLEKIFKTTPETKRGIGLVLIGTVVMLSMLFIRVHMLPGPLIYRHSRGYGMFTHQYAYLSLRTFRI